MEKRQRQSDSKMVSQIFKKDVEDITKLIKIFQKAKKEGVTLVVMDYDDYKGVSLDFYKVIKDETEAMATLRIHAIKKWREEGIKIK